MDCHSHREALPLKELAHSLRVGGFLGTTMILNCQVSAKVRTSFTLLWLSKLHPLVRQLHPFLDQTELATVTGNI